MKDGDCFNLEGWMEADQYQIIWIIEWQNRVTFQFWKLILSEERNYTVYIHVEDTFPQNVTNCNTDLFFRLLHIVAFTFSFFFFFFLKNTEYLPENQVVLNACEDLVCEKCSAESSKGYEYMGKLQMSNLMRKRIKSGNTCSLSVLCGLIYFCLNMHT